MFVEESYDEEQFEEDEEEEEEGAPQQQRATYQFDQLDDMGANGADTGIVYSLPSSFSFHYITSLLAFCLSFTYLFDYLFVFLQEIW